MIIELDFWDALKSVQGTFSAGFSIWMRSPCLGSARRRSTGLPKRAHPHRRCHALARDSHPHARTCTPPPAALPPPLLSQARYPSQSAAARFVVSLLTLCCVTALLLVVVMIVGSPACAYTAHVTSA